LSYYKIPGLIKTQKKLFSKYSQENRKSRIQTLDTIQVLLKGIEQNLNKRHISIEDLSLKYHAAFLNLQGLVYTQKNVSHPYGRLKKIAETEQQKYKRLRQKELILAFIPSQNLYHKVISNSKYLRVHISVSSLNLSDEYFQTLFSILFRRILRLSIPVDLREKLNTFEEKSSYKNEADPKIPFHSNISNGRYFDLEKMFNKLNSKYFTNSLNRPSIKWSRRANRRRLGHFDSRRQEITINRLLDNPDIPHFVVEGILYHELLHIVHPIQNNNGRRVIHGRKFKIDEQKYENHRILQNWIKTDFPTVVKNFKNRSRN
jgi:hypothetical protein